MYTLYLKTLLQCLEFQICGPRASQKRFFSPQFALIAVKIDILNVNVITNKPLININVTKD